MRKTVPEKLRVKILIRDKFECQECGKFSYIKYNRWKRHSDHEVHHIYTNKNNNLENLITLCNKCHLETHGGDWKKKPIKFYKPVEMPECAEWLSYYHMVSPLFWLAQSLSNIVSSNIVKSTENEDT